MGTNVQANLSFGVYLNEEAVPWRDADGEIDTSVCGDDWIMERLCSYIEDAGERQAAFMALGVEVLDICHPETPEYIIAAKGHVHTAWDESPHSFGSDVSLDSASGVVAKLIDVCKRLGIKNPEPQWWLSCWSDY